jgi:hypothetical protein
LLLLVAVAWGGLYLFGGYGSFDASQQGQEKKAKLRVGMTHSEVFAVTGDPRKYRILNRHKKRAGADEIEYVEPSAPVNFDRARVDQHIKDGTLPEGFLCTFNYSTSVAFTVTFDKGGIVTGIDDALTMADLLDQK